jgi:tetratricopeptide (TPR) repeat protein
MKRRRCLVMAMSCGWALKAAAAGISPLPAPLPKVPTTDNPFGDTKPYEICVRSIDLNPGDTFEEALIWRDRGGGLPAERCAALALIALRQPGEAAVRLEALSRRPGAGSLPDRAQLLVQSGNAWLLAGQPQLAEDTFSAALKLTPRDVEIWIDRARARAARNNYPDAEADLNNALAIDRDNAQALVLRAAARQKLRNNPGYRADIAAALAASPRYPEALVERGSIRAAEGNLQGARADWIEVLTAVPKSPAAEVARARIQALETGPRLRRR